MELQSGNAQFGSKSTILLAVWPWNLTDDLEQGKSEGFDSCNRPSNLKLDSNRQFSALVTVKFDGWPWKTIGHVFYTTSSFVHHFKSIGEFKLDLQSRNDQFGSKLVKYYPYDLEIWWMTLENNRAPLLCCFKLCAAFRSRWWIQTGVTVRKHPIWVNFDDF